MIKFLQKFSRKTPANDSQAHKEQVKRGWRGIASTAAILITAPLLAIFITVFVFQSYEVFGLSMSTTLDNGDRLIVQKLSKNWAKLRGQEYIPQRGEIIVFVKPPSVSGLSGDVNHLIKRVIGLPGDRVVVKDGKIKIYNAQNLDGFDPDAGKEYAKDIITTPGNVDIIVGEGEVFVCGDNRTNSYDSRRFGTIDTDSITGVAKIRFAPVGDFEVY